MKKFIALLIGLTLIASYSASAPAKAESDADVSLRPICSAGGVACVQEGAEADTAVGSFTQGQEIALDVVVKNPGKQNIVSVRTWLKYDIARLEGVAIDAKDSPFTLVAPGEDEFDATQGQVKLGRANISGGVNMEEIKVAAVRFKVKTAEPITTTIGFYDYQVSELGHTSINVIDNGFPVNLLNKAPESLKINLNGGGTSTISVPVPVTATGTATGTPPPAASGTVSGGVANDFVPMANLARPSNLRVGTQPGVASLTWDKSKEKDLKGYYLYYGRQSGSYTRRHDTERSNKAEIMELTQGETYYFAVTAYDKANRESDYSDEVAVIIGQPLSSTAPMDGNKLGRVPNQPQNGPLAGWILVFAIGLSTAFFFRRKQTN
ncbi:fibronectin type III domain-containing protein [Candidatus Peregrinibacteria bacterium]|nr:fibronectin type III domain-containing protein [Candidatus Peregrinibacteria bacterium]